LEFRMSANLSRRAARKSVAPVAVAVVEATPVEVVETVNEAVETTAWAFPKAADFEVVEVAAEVVEAEPANTSNALALLSELLQSDSGKALIAEHAPKKERRSNSQAVKDSWRIPSVAIARKTRHAVNVEVDGETVAQSVTIPHAFDEIAGLAGDGRFTRFRLKLKEQGENSITGKDGRTYRFIIAQ
jgi:hypothetical protein